MSPDGTLREKRVCVAVRCRPLSARELGAGSGKIVSLEQFKKVVVSDPVEAAHREGPGWARAFAFDAVFGDDAALGRERQQEDVYRGLGVPLLAHAWRGYNASIFAYGQTGSGKTFSMLGGAAPTSSLRDGGDRGLIPRVCCGLFDAADAHAKSHDIAIEASYMEIYNETVRDLLLPTGKALRVREHPRDGACVPDLTVVRVANREELVALLQVGSKSRATAATRGNARSSRSHAVFTLALSRRKRGGDVDTDDGGAFAADAWWRDVDLDASSSRATIRLVDLAGSERVAVTGTDGARLREAKSINRSLATLCDVIEALAANSRSTNGAPAKPRFVPYRNSALIGGVEGRVARRVDAAREVRAELGPEVRAVRPRRGEHLRGERGRARREEGVERAGEVQRLAVVEPEGRDRDRVAGLQDDVERGRSQTRAERVAAAGRIVDVELGLARARVGVGEDVETLVRRRRPEPDALPPRDLRGTQIFNVRVIERLGPDPSAALRELDESNWFVQKSAEFDFDLTELENFKVWWGRPKPMVDFHTGSSGGGIIQ